MTKIDLSILIISYNTRDLTLNCLDSLERSLRNSPSLNTEIIVVDNASTDGSTDSVKKHLRKIEQNDSVSTKFIQNSQNIGFSRANNEGLAAASGKYLLFLNSDVVITDVNFADLVYYMNKNPSVGILTVDVRLPSGQVDMASHRGFPTVWNSFTYFTRLEKVFSPVPQLKKYFGGYHLTHLDLNTIHEIDSPSGAFYFTRKKILDDAGGFDTRFFISP